MAIQSNYIWIIILLIGLPAFSETSYSQSVHIIAISFNTTISHVEYSFVTYLLGFAIGTLFWGILSDKTGRRACIFGGLLFYILGSMGCYYSESIIVLLASRLLQAFGASMGSVIGQVIIRDLYSGKELAKIFAKVGAGVAFFPAIGSFLGAEIAHNFGWYNVFLFLVNIGVILSILTLLFVKETGVRKPIDFTSIKNTFLEMSRDKNLICYGLIAGSFFAMNFIYFQEGAFFFINLLGSSKDLFQISFIATALSAFLGSRVSTQLQDLYQPESIIKIGVFIILSINIIFFTLVVLNNKFCFSNSTMVIITICWRVVNIFGVLISIGNTLSLPLAKYQSRGTAQSFFGGFCYIICSILCAGMAILHNQQLYTMPLYHLSLALFICVVMFVILKDKTISKS